MSLTGARPPSPAELVRAGERISFLYVEHALLSRADNAITVKSSRGVVHVPAAQLSCVLIGPGCRVTHHAVMLLAESGSSAVWVGESGGRLYAAGRGLSRCRRPVEVTATRVRATRARVRA